MRGYRFLSVCGLVLLAMTLSACVTTWTRLANPRMTGPEGSYHVTAPACWIHAAGITDKICISKDGPSLNWVEVSHFKRSAGFPLTQVNLNGTYLISEVAEYYLTELKTRYQNVTVEHISTEPANIDGTAGFRMRLEVVLPSGLVFDILSYGMMDDDNFYQLMYKAPRIHYFEKELDTFEDFVNTFKREI